MTRRWVPLVPCVSREHCEGVSVNAPGFAGSLFVKERRAVGARPATWGR
ncbi:MAG: hypothetical protein MZW92_22090 [Comamonadaceae bacterium]|nr:hypothetical protein [Comamonadaceae bacterium]